MMIFQTQIAGSYYGLGKSNELEMFIASWAFSPAFFMSK